MGELEERYIKFSSAFLILIFVAGLMVGGIASCYITFREINNLNNEVSNLRSQVSKLWGIRPEVINQSITIYQNSTALAELYERVENSVVLIVGTISEGTVQGSGFVYNFSGTMVVITNYHVIHGTTSLSVTFSNGNGYAAAVNGTDPYADLAVLLVDAPEDEFTPLEVVSSSTLRVGDPVIAIGNPYGLVGSMTTGVVSALGRTITEEYTGGFGIANIIQTSTPINPGNSGGPLLNFDGKVVGITTAIVADSQGLGFAIPSSTLLNEVFSLVTYGTYEGHSYLGLKGIDMDYETAQEMGVTVTYGWRVVEVMPGEPSATAGVRVNDIIVGINGTSIRNGDDMASYLEEHTLPGQTVILNVRRESQTRDIPVTLGSRPS
ncbi:trypsin-like peptidase domain-containing protein, partial [Candidatus Bathyarchaeota archaeon]|nr:trypsin-like peptidase domain-containing protein [Candidatus Bathyarchaeota archaeon]